MFLFETWIPINNQKIYAHYWVHNHQPSASGTIVFLHEALGSVAQWRDFPKILGELTEFDVLIYDRLGHGLSDPMLTQRDKKYLHHEAWKVTPSVLKHFKIENPILFGHSDGGTIALLFASKYPTRALITEAAHIIVEDITLKGIEQAIPNKAFLIDRLKRYHGVKTENLFNVWAETWLNSNFRDWNIENVLSKIHCPTLLLQGNDDEYATARQLQLIASGIGIKAETVLIPHCGHTPHKEFPEFVLDKTLSFLKRI